MKYEEVFPVPREWLKDVDESLADTVVRWAEQEVMAGRLEHAEDLDGFLIPAMRKLFVDIGLQRLLIPEEMGGAGLSSPDTAVTLCAVLEQVGRADMGIGFLLANTAAIQAALGIEPHRSESSVEVLSRLFGSGEDTVVGSLILPGTGDGAATDLPEVNGLVCQVAAVPAEGGWILSGGNIRPQCAGASAGVFGTICQTEPGKPMLILVPAASEGLERAAPFKKTGLAASDNADLAFREVRVPGELCVFADMERYRETMGWYFMGCAALCSGALLASWEILREWGETRVIKGKGQVFRENPLVASLMGEIARRIAVSRILPYHLARMLSRPETYGPAGSPATYQTAVAVVRTVCNSAMEAIDYSMELMGSAGYAAEWNLERYWRDVKTIEACLGPETAAQADMARHCFGCQTL